MHGGTSWLWGSSKSESSTYSLSLSPLVKVKLPLAAFGLTEIRDGGKGAIGESDKEYEK